MLFNSYAFLFGFLPTVLLLFYGLARLGATRWAFGALVVASMVFYAGWEPKFLPLLLASAAFNYALGRRLAAHPHRGLLAAGLAVNLAVLGYFKYANFFLDTAQSLLGRSPTLLGIVLPLGLSFITFQKIAFLVDSHQGKTGDYTLKEFLLFVLFFPQLIAGPIVHHAEFMPQLKTLRIFAFEPRNVLVGAFCIAAGLFKKVVIGDTLAQWVAPAFAAPAQLSALEAWGGAVAYALQIYFDFSGYSEMAIGLALLFNLRLPANFRSPYQATSIIEFWRRWHMTLSRFLRDYVYIPLGGNRHGPVRRHLNLMATMLLGGLWHGAGWTFVAWGGLHGLYLVANHRLRAWRGERPLGLWGRSLGRAATLLAVLVAWVFFRAADFSQAAAYLAAMAGAHGLGGSGLLLAGSSYGHRPLVCTLLALSLWVGLAPDTLTLSERLRPSPAWAGLFASLFVAGVLLLDRPTAFIYWQF